MEPNLEQQQQQQEQQQQQQQKQQKQNKKATAAKQPTRVQSLDCFQRINFLYQAAHLLAVKDGSKQQPKLAGISRMFGCQLKQVAQRLVLRIDPHVKRTLCKRCHGTLIPGITSTVRIKGLLLIAFLSRCDHDRQARQS
eukprot:jgi/Hompol1/532/HPOL_002531-RA